MNIDIRRPSIRWTLILAGWIVLGVLMTGQTYLGYARAGHPLTTLQTIGLVLPYVALWILFTPGILWLARKLPLERSHRARNIALHLLFSIVIAVFQNVFSNILVMYFKEELPISWPWIWRSLITLFDYGVLLYWIILLVREAYESYERGRLNELKASQLETQLVDARLQALKTQLQPHFLFNTLHSISELIHEDIEAADTMIARLGDFLRLTLENSGAQLGSLHKELDSLRCYLEIEQTRFRGHLGLQMEVEDEVLDAQLPCFLWQPMVENAIRHGIATSRNGGRIIIRARQRNGVLQLQVEDNGAGLVMNEQHEPMFHEGIGLANTRAILQHMYGSAYALTLANAEKGGVVATLEIPFSIMEE